MEDCHTKLPVPVSVPGIIWQEECAHKHVSPLSFKECTGDNDPVYNFWCFPCESYSGILGSAFTNNRSFEI